MPITGADGSTARRAIDSHAQSAGELQFSKTQKGRSELPYELKTACDSERRSAFLGHPVEPVWVAKVATSRLARVVYRRPARAVRATELDASFWSETWDHLRAISADSVNDLRRVISRWLEESSV